MHLHIISSIDPQNYFNSNIASDRLRLSYLYNAGKELGYKITGSLNPELNADIFYIGKVTDGLAHKILEIIPQFRTNNSKIIIDYTDDLLSSEDAQNRNRRLVYEKLIKTHSCITVPVEGLSKKFKKKGKEVFVIPDGIDDLPIKKPTRKKNNKRNVIWHGHSSNIKSLIRIVSDELAEFDFNLHIVSNAPSFQVLKQTKLNIKPKFRLFGHLWSLQKLISVSQKCDFAILPADKQWASANRLITNFHLGLPVIAESISSYNEFSKFYSSFKEKQIIEMFNNPESWHESVILAQMEIESKFNKKTLTDLWKNILK